MNRVLKAQQCRGRENFRHPTLLDAKSMTESNPDPFLKVLVFLFICFRLDRTITKLHQNTPLVLYERRQKAKMKVDARCWAGRKNKKAAMSSYLRGFGRFGE